MAGKSFSLHRIFAFATLAAVALILFANCGGKGPRSHDNAEEGWIGVYVQDLDSELRRYLDIDERYGVLVNDVVDDSPAEDAGLREEDVIIRFDGRRVRNSRDLTRAVKRLNPGDKAKVEVIRNNSKKTLTLRMGEKPGRRYTYRNRYRTREHSPDVFVYRSRGAWLGVQTTNLDRDLAEYFEVGVNDGVLVLEVVEESPAESAGLKSGDIILKIDGDRVRDTEELSDLISDRDAGDEIEIEIKRRGKTKKLHAELDRSSYRSGFNFDIDNMNRWKEDAKSWKEDVKSWAKELKNRHKYDRDYVYEVEDQIRRNIEQSIRNSLEIPLEIMGAELGTEMGAVGREIEQEIEREMRRLEEELNRIHVELDFWGWGESI